MPEIMEELRKALAVTSLKLKVFEKKYNEEHQKNFNLEMRVAELELLAEANAQPQKLENTND